MEEISLQEMRALLDANACLRYLLCDNEDQASRVSQMVEKGAEVTLEVLAECVYVLDGVYEVSRPEICKTLVAFLDEVTCARAIVAKAALEFFSEHNLDFVDCVLLAEKYVNDCEIVTFDKKLQRELEKLES